MADCKKLMLRYLLIGVCLLSSSIFLLAQSGDALFPPKPEPAVYVHDYAGWLNGSDKARLEEKLRAYFQSTSTQIVVMIRPDLGDYDKASYAIELGNRWGIGKKDKNNGVLMLIKSQPPDRGIFIATGYGAEGALPDITCARIIRNTMAPLFKQQRYTEGIDAGLNDIMAALKGEFTNDNSSGNGTDIGTALFVMFIFLIIGMVILYFVSKKMSNNRPRNYHDNLPPNTRRHDPWGGGGWWIGGGGGGWSSGGGGSSWGGGSDGGSFGGGDFGGGGAGGDW